MLKALRSWLVGDDVAEEIGREERPLPLPEPTAPRVLVLIHDPKLDDGGRLRPTLGWREPRQLLRQYIADVSHASYGLVNYQVVEERLLDHFPPKIDGFRYSGSQFLHAWRSRRGFHQPDQLDYRRLIDEQNLVTAVNRDQIDEVWLFGFPYAGYYESHMVGPAPIFCNSPPLPDRRFERNVVIMGFSYERGVGEMLENLGHRVESCLRHAYRRKRGERNLWERFIRYDKSHPGRAECGNVHFAPNSLRDYDWGNRTPVLSRADSWYDFPRLERAPRRMTCREWGDGDIRAHHIWWLRHLPHVVGTTDGMRNNWWAYAVPFPGQPFPA